MGNLTDKINRSHERVGEYLTKGLKKGAGYVFKGIGFPLATVGGLGLAGTIGANIIKSKAIQMSNLDFFLGNLFYAFLPENKKLGLAVYEFVKDKDLTLPYIVGLGTLIGGYAIYRFGKKIQA